MERTNYTTEGQKQHSLFLESIQNIRLGMRTIQKQETSAPHKPVKLLCTQCDHFINLKFHVDVISSSDTFVHETGALLFRIGKGKIRHVVFAKEKCFARSYMNAFHVGSRNCARNPVSSFHIGFLRFSATTTREHTYTSETLPQDHYAKTIWRIIIHLYSRSYLAKGHPAKRCPFCGYVHF